MISHIDNSGMIRAELARHGITQTKIADILRVSVVSVNQVISGQRKSARIREAISWAIGKTVSDLWPDKRPVAQTLLKDKVTSGGKVTKKVPSPGRS